MIGKRLIAPQDRPRIAGALAALVTLAGVLMQRFLVNVETGGRGLLPWFVPILLGVGLICLWGDATRSTRVRWPILVVVWGPFLLCVGLLPLLAVTLGLYSSRVVYSSVSDALLPFAIVLIGARIAMLVQDRSRPLATALIVSAPIVALYAIGQWAYNEGLLDLALWRPFVDWDRSVADAYGVIQISRSSGPYINPNILGFWGALAFVLAATLVRGGLSGPLTLGAAALTVVFAQSRGSFVALVAGILVLLVLGSSSGLERRSRLGLLASFLAVAAVVLMLSLTGVGLGGVSRLVDGLGSLLPGATVDPSLSGRFELWSAAGALSAVYPLGTWGPPETLLGTAIDNDWVRLFLQASIPGVAAVGAMLIGGVLFADRSRPYGRALIACSVVVAVSALTETPLTYPPIALYWLLVGFAVVRPRDEPGPRRRVARRGWLRQYRRRPASLVGAADGP